MPELRKDPITGRWVIIATDRAKRPSDFLRQSTPPPGSASAPSTTATNIRRRPRSLLPQQRRARRTRLASRVVPNKFPVLGIEGELNRQGEGMYDKMNGIGAHEVIIETPQHADDARRNAGTPDRRSSLGVKRPRQRFEAGPPLSLIILSRITARRRARRWNIRTAS